VLDKAYETVAGYPEPGRGVFVAVAYASTGP
jgi:outer membrane cobalamin receptor